MSICIVLLRMENEKNDFQCSLNFFENGEWDLENVALFENGEWNNVI